MMAVLSSALTAAILAAGQGSFPGSQQLPMIALGVGNAMAAWLPVPTNVLAQGVTTGLAGSGVATGKMQFVPAGQVFAGLGSAGMTGISAAGISTAVENGVASVLNASAQYSGVSVGVSSGTDVNKVSLSNAATLVALLNANLVGSGVAGITGPQLASGLGTGLSALVATGFGFGGVAPVIPAPSPAAGTSISQVF